MAVARVAFFPAGVPITFQLQSCKSSTRLCKSTFISTGTLRRKRLRFIHHNLPSSVPKCNAATPTPPSDDDGNEIQSDNHNHNDIASTATTKSSFSNTIRIILAAISMTGALEALYLTYNKLFSSPGAICATQGCLDVLTGPFSSLFGIPLSLLGTLAYTSFATLCLWPITDDVDEYVRRDAATRPVLLFLSTAQFAFSLYLLFLLKFIIKSFCPYCVFSAVISFTLFMVTAFIGKAVPSFKQSLPISAASVTFASIAASASLILGWPVHIAARPPGGELQAPPEITRDSGVDEMRLAKKLAKKQTKMYGAFWCTHCYDQKQRFGKKAFAMLKYVECDKFGAGNQAQMCRDKRIPGYPTWEIDGELFPGEIEIGELERLVDEADKASTP